MGGAGGALLVGVLSDAYGAPQGLGWALITVFAIFVVAGGLFGFAAMRRSDTLPEFIRPAGSPNIH